MFTLFGFLSLKEKFETEMLRLKVKALLIRFFSKEEQYTVRVCGTADFAQSRTPQAYNNQEEFHKMLEPGTAGNSVFVALAANVLYGRRWRKYAAKMEEALSQGDHRLYSKYSKKYKDAYRKWWKCYFLQSRLPTYRIEIACCVG